MIRAALLLALTTGSAQAVTHTFCWRGADGYRIEGYISYPDTAQGWLITQTTVTGFGITGWQHDRYLGQWSRKQLTQTTSWSLRFDSRTLTFPMGGHLEDGTYQAWNAGGQADDCGSPGFGFNGGNRAQDICVNGVFIDESGIDPDTRLSVSPNPETPCGPLPMSSLATPRRHG